MGTVNYSLRIVDKNDTVMHIDLRWHYPMLVQVPGVDGSISPHPLSQNFGSPNGLVAGVIGISVCYAARQLRLST